MTYVMGSRDWHLPDNYAQTKGWGTATSGVRQLRRMDEKLERRAIAKNPRRERWLARQEDDEAEDASGEGDAG
jgi:hypothetical protein